MKMASFRLGWMYTPHTSDQEYKVVLTMEYSLHAKSAQKLWRQSRYTYADELADTVRYENNGHLLNQYCLHVACAYLWWSTAVANSRRALVVSA